jgi:hypothetical protein
MFGCKDDNSPTKPNNMSHANQLAREGFTMLNDEILNMSEEDMPEINEADDLMQASVFNQIEAKFTEALEADIDNPMASVGMGILEIMRINYDDSLWSLFDDFIELDSQPDKHASLFNSQFELLAHAPLAAMKGLNAAKTGDISLYRMQQLIDSSVIPRLNSSLNHLNYAVALADSNYIMIDTGEEFVEIDCGEIYAFRASVKMIKAAFLMINAYDLDMIGMDGSYNWIDNMFEDHDAPYPQYWEDNYPTAYDYEYDEVNDVLYLHFFEMDDDWYSEKYDLQVQLKTTCYNLQNNDSFATLRSGYLTSAQDNIQGALDDIRSGIDYIQNETDSQSNDIIKLAYLNDFEDHIQQDEDNPEFMHDWTGIDDAINWLESLVTGSITLTGHEDEEFTLNLNAFFSGAVTDARDVIPYYHWNDLNNDWLEIDTEWWDYYNNPNSWYTHFYDLNGNYHTEFEGVSQMYVYYDVFRGNSGYNTDPYGVEIPENEDPYFPDYTFHAIFPGMTRAKLNRIFDN